MVFPLPNPQLRFDRARTKAIVADILAGLTVRQIVERHRCAKYMVTAIRHGRWHPELVAELVREIETEKLSAPTFFLPAVATPVTP